MIAGWWWLLPWDFSPTVIGSALLAAWWYLRSGAAVAMWRRTCFWTGLLILYGALQSGLDYYADHAFFVHRIQHLLLHHLGPFLVALGLPPLETRAWSRYPWMSTALFNGFVLFWLVPAVHFPAMLDWRLYRVMNWSIAVTGLIFWITALRATALGAGRRIAMMMAVIPVQIAIGALIFLAGHDLYPVYSLCGRAFGMTALQDQQLGGLILWIPGAMMSVAGILIVALPGFRASHVRA